MRQQKVVLMDSEGKQEFGVFEIPASHIGNSINWNGKFFIMDPKDYKAAPIPYYEIGMIKIPS